MLEAVKNIDGSEVLCIRKKQPWMGEGLTQAPEAQPPTVQEYTTSTRAR